MTTAPTQERLISTKELSERWGASAGGLVNDRSRGRGPKYVKLGERVRYRLRDIESWEEAHLVTAGDR